MMRSTKDSSLPCLLRSKLHAQKRRRSFYLGDIHAFRNSMGKLVLVTYCFVLCFLRTSISLDSITASESLKDGETLVSAGGTFELGFFSPGNSKGRYLGVWYNNISPLTVVWVANRETPLNNTWGVLEVNNDGVLLLLNGANNIVWSSNNSRTAEKPIAKLLDAGNFVVENENASNLDNLIWQSFDYPCDTLLPGMKLGWDLATGLDRFLSSWKSTDDPRKGDYVVKIDPRGYPQIFQLERGQFQTRPGSWNGIRFTGYPALKPNPVFSYEFVLNEKEVYYEFQLLNTSVLSRFTLTPLGIGQRLIWTKWTRNWELHSTGPVDQCENYAICGAYTGCNVDNSPICSCLKGFVPKFPEKWKAQDWSGGCIRRTSLSCNDEDGFVKYTNVKLPDTSSSWFDKTMNLEECRILCLQNCSCTAYTNLDIRNHGSGCLIWFADLVDMREFTEEGQDLFLRVAASDKDDIKDSGNPRKKIVIIAVVSVMSITALILLGLTIYLWKKKIWLGMTKTLYRKDYKNKMRRENMDLPTMDFSSIAKATDNFSGSNILGEGGFGLVYKGVLEDGQEIAVKRLSKNSGQGPEEFRNEVMLIAKLQHRNLVKVLGCCIQNDEKLLIYEFMPNRSLDYFIFDPTRNTLLDWTKRFQIIGGIARGLLYLHQDSRLRIIHRDLKTSNVLLDGDMNPKISDFGLARMFYGDQLEANTKRVMGTYGYMPPEYASRGSFSIKSDVFSFGVIVLEIVSGRKNREFSDPQHDLNLLGHAWRLWTEERPLELIDESLGNSVTRAEVLRCIHMALLCVHQRPQDRPDMSTVVLMLNGEKPLPKPMQPAFYPHQVDCSSRKCEMCYSNEISITLLEAR